MPDCLTPPKGGGGIGYEPTVDADHPDLHALGQAQRPPEIAGEDVARQPVVGVIDPRQQLVLIVPGDDRGDGAERSSVRTISAVGGDVRQDPHR